MTPIANTINSNARTPEEFAIALEAYHTKLSDLIGTMVSETRNIKAGTFRRFDIEFIREEDGVLALTSHPFAWVIVGEDNKPEALICRHETNDKMACGRPYSAKASYIQFAAGTKDFATGRDMAEKLASKMTASGFFGTCRAELWDATSLSIYNRKLIKFVDELGI